MTSINDSKGNAWLYNTILLKPSRFLTAMRLRGNMTSDEVATNKVVAQNVKFRKCRTCNETLVTCWVCGYTKAQRNGRHDEIRGFVSKTAPMKEKVQSSRKLLFRPQQVTSNMI